MDQHGSRNTHEEAIAVVPAGDDSDWERAVVLGMTRTGWIEM